MAEEAAEVRAGEAWPSSAAAAHERFSQNTSRVLIQRDDDDWTGLADANARRRIQNRLNQRALRQRRAAQARATAAAADHEAASQSGHGERRLAAKGCTSTKSMVKFNERNNVAKFSENGHPADEEGGECGSRAVKAAPQTIHGMLDYLQTYNPILKQYHARRILHFLRCVAYPAFDLHTPRALGSNPLDIAIYQMVLSDSLLMNTQILRLATEQLRRAYDPGLWQLLLDLQADVFPRLRQALSTATAAGGVSDGVIWAVHILSITKTPPSPREALGLFDRPVASLGYTGAIGPYIFDPRHHSVFPFLLRQRGGLRAVRSPALAEVFQFVDVLSAAHDYGAPAFGFTDTSLLLLDRLAARRAPPARVARFGVDPAFQEVLLDVLVCCAELEEYSVAVKVSRSRAAAGAGVRGGGGSASAQPPKPPKLLLQHRNLIHHRLLSIPPGQPATEICRLATLLFVYGVIWSHVAFPHPRYWDPMRKLSEDLRAALSDPMYTRGADPGFLLWAAMMGGLACSSYVQDCDEPDVVGAADDALPSFFIQELRLRNLHEDLQLSSWTEAKSLLSRYLWMDYACDRGGQMLWDRVAPYFEPAKQPPLPITVVPWKVETGET